MKRKQCFNCSYVTVVKVGKMKRYYCNDRDCTVDPFEPECDG